MPWPRHGTWTLEGMMKTYDKLPPAMYLVHRSSGYVNLWMKKPCAEAFPIMIPRPTLDSNYSLPSDQLAQWFPHGCEHGKYLEKWAVQHVDMLSFVRKYGPCIVMYAFGCPVIEIYDTRRE